MIVLALAAILVQCPDLPPPPPHVGPPDFKLTVSVQGHLARIKLENVSGEALRLARSSWGFQEDVSLLLVVDGKMVPLIPQNRPLDDDVIYFDDLPPGWSDEVTVDLTLYVRRDGGEMVPPFEVRAFLGRRNSKGGVWIGAVWSG